MFDPLRRLTEVHVLARPTPGALNRKKNHVGARVSVLLLSRASREREKRGWVMCIEVYVGSVGLGVQWDPVNWE